MTNMNYTVVIPSLNPDEKLVHTVDSLITLGISDIIVINDGSRADCLPIFDGLAARPEITVLTHKVNRGKGAGLRTAFEYFLENRPDSEGVVTADADGQHTAVDIAACAADMVTHKTKKGERRVILGTRNFSGDGVPRRSKIGNRFTSLVFLLFVGMRISDTQTGLRAIPREYLPDMLEVAGDRYEYETNMLFMLKTRRIPYESHTITTVYLDDNKSSHFRPVRDSLRIYSLIIKFLASSIASWVVDNGLFLLFKLLFKSLVGEKLDALWVVCARIFSSLFNFTVNKKAVFKNSDPIKPTVIKYYCLAVPIMLISAGSVYLFEWLTKIDHWLPVLLFKIAVDTALYIASFRLQREWVFARKRTREEKVNDK